MRDFCPIFLHEISNKANESSAQERSRSRTIIVNSTIFVHLSNSGFTLINKSAGRFRHIYLWFRIGQLSWLAYSRGDSRQPRLISDLFATCSQHSGNLAGFDSYTTELLTLHSHNLPILSLMQDVCCAVDMAALSRTSREQVANKLWISRGWREYPLLAPKHLVKNAIICYALRNFGALFTHPLSLKSSWGRVQVNIRSRSGRVQVKFKSSLTRIHPSLFLSPEF